MNSQGLIISILILISLMLICHISNYLYNKNLKEKNNFSNLTLSIPTTTKPIDYNKIYYEPKGITSNLSCSQAQQQANIPCDIVSSSCTSVPTYGQLSDSELAVLYKVAYEESGREVLKRALKITNFQ